MIFLLKTINSTNVQTIIPMKTSSLLLTLAAGAFAASVASAQSGFSENWSEYALDTNLIGAEGSPYYAAGNTTDGTAMIVSSDGKHVLQTVPGGGNTSYYVGRTFDGLSGQVLAEVDLKVGSGGAEIFLSDRENPLGGGAGALRVQFRGGSSVGRPVHAYDGAIIGTGLEVGLYNTNTWYRVSILMNIDAENGTLSSYSVSIMDLATQQSVGSLSEIDFSGSPTLVNAITFGSGLGATATSQWANLSVTPVIPEPSHMAGGLGLLIAAAVLYARRRR